MSEQQDLGKAPAVGTRLRGQYELSRFLGAGGMGAVYEALAPDGKRVAVKVLLRGLGGRALDRFKREANVTSSLTSPHIVPTLDAGIDPDLGLPFMVMPLLVGLDLQELIDRVGPVHPTAAVRITRQACLALEIAHKEGVVHRDVKPANIYLEHDSGGKVTARVLDFGVAKWADSGDQALTRTGTLLGTPLYMSPEQALQSKTVDPRADVWSLGASLYCALAGRMAFEGSESLADLYVAITTKDMPLLQELAPWVDPGLATVLHGTLIRELEARCPSVRAFADALEPYAFGTDALTASMLEPVPDELLRTRAGRAGRPTSWQEVLGRRARPSVAPPMKTEQTDPILGQRLLGRYTVLRLIGKGGMGAVYEAACADGSRVAVKVIDAAEAGRDESLRRRFVREVRAVSSIKSEHVVRVIEADTDPSQQMPFIVMEILRGIDLGALIERQGALRPDAMARLFVQACEGLSAAHAQGIVHRDIKPANLFLHQLPTGEVVVKICDFGIAKQISSEAGAPAVTANLTRTGGVIGSPMFMSPEQAKGSRTIDHRSDIWSLGASLLHALTGIEPWAGKDTMGEILVGILTEPVPHTQDRAPWVAPGLAEIVHKALERDPARRFGTAAELAQALMPFAGASVALRPEDLQSVSPEMRAARMVRANLPGTSSVPGVAAGLTVAASPVGGAATGNLVQTVTPEPKRSGAGVALVATIAVVVAAGGGYFWWSTHQNTGAGGTGSASGSTSAAHGEPTGTADGPTSMVITVTVNPAIAHVTVDGKEQGLEPSGTLRLSGKPGQSFGVVVEHEGKKVETRVVVTSEGAALPDHIDLDAVAAGPSAQPSGVGKVPPAGPGAAPPGTATGSARQSPTSSARVKERENW